MADHLIGKFWGISGALAAALLMLALIAPGAEAAAPGSGALGQLAAVVPSPAQSAVSAALSQVPSATGAGASGVATPASPPSVHVAVPQPPPVPVVTRPAPPSTPATPVPPAPLPVPAPPGVAGQAVRMPTQSSAQPEAAVQAALSEANPSSSARPDAALGRRTPAHRSAHSRARRHAGSVRSVSAASARRAPIARTTAARLWSPVSGLETSRRGVQPAAPARRADARRESRRAHHPAPRRSHPGGALTASESAIPLSAALPPGGADGSAAGAGSAAAGAAAAALLVLFGLCILRALLPGLLGLGLAPARSAFLVWRLERPG
jgi:translation initiation factor IF-2